MKALNELPPMIEQARGLLQDVAVIIAYQIDHKAYPAADLHGYINKARAEMSFLRVDLETIIEQMQKAGEL